MAKSSYLSNKNSSLLPRAIFVFLFIISFGFFSFSTKTHAATYSSSGTITSDNLLSGLGVTAIDAFGYNISAMPTGTSVQIRFSQDATSWYSSAGVENGWDTLSSGDFLAVGDAIDLSDLDWRRAHLYYQTQFTTSDTAETAILDEVVVFYTSGPSVETNVLTSIEPVSATANGEITALSGGNATIRGFEYGLTETATWTVSESGDFSAETFSQEITDLSPNTTYHIRAFATNPESTGYGLWTSFTTGAYYASGTLTSTNLLEGQTIAGVGKFEYTLSAKPAESTASIQFSQDGSTWYNSSGTLGGTDTMETGLRAGESRTLNLCKLAWTGNDFYYKIAFGANASGETPVLDGVSVNADDTDFTCGPIGYWRFDEGYGDTAHDGTAYENDGDITGATWSNDGKFDKALKFTSTGNNNVSIGSMPSGVNSICFWTKLDSTTEKILDLDGGTHYIQASGGTVSAQGFDSPTVYVNGRPTSTVGTDWTHICAVTNTSITASAVTIGKVGDDYLDGLVDEVKIYNYSLTEDEVRVEYNRGFSLNMGTGQNDADAGTTNLIAEWKLDDGEGSTAYDIVGTNHLTLTDTTWTNGKIGKGLKFNGTSAEGNASGSYTLTSGLSIQAYIRPNTTNRMGIIKLKSSGGSCAADCDTAYIYVSDSKWSFVRFYNWGITGKAWDCDTANCVLDIEEWNHIAVVVSNTNSDHVSFYKNGALILSRTSANTTWGTGTYPTTSNAGIQIGAENATRFFDGSIDHIKIFNTALTPAQIAWEYNKGGPVAWYKFDEGSGTVAYDSSDNANHGTLTNMDPATDYVTGRINTGLDFDGSNDGIYVGDVSAIDTNIFTWAAWVKFDSVTSTGGADQSVMTNQDLTEPYNQGGVMFGTIEYDSEVGISAIVSPQNMYRASENIAGNYSNGVWYHLVGTYDGSSVKFYRNGVLRDENTSSFNFDMTYADPFTIGYRNGGSQYFDGQIDDVRIYNYALTESQIKTLYNNGAIYFE